MIKKTRRETSKQFNKIQIVQSSFSSKHEYFRFQMHFLNPNFL